MQRDRTGEEPDADDRRRPHGLERELEGRCVAADRLQHDIRLPLAGRLEDGVAVGRDDPDGAERAPRIPLVNGARSP
jgi:hypothetical protein